MLKYQVFREKTIDIARTSIITKKKKKLQACQQFILLYQEIYIYLYTFPRVLAIFDFTVYSPSLYSIFFNFFN